MKAKPYALHLRVDLKRVPPETAGDALGMLLRRYASWLCGDFSLEVANASPVSQQAAQVAHAILGRPYALDRRELPRRVVLLDDTKAKRLAASFRKTLREGYEVIVPHMVYLPLLRAFLANIRQKTPELAGLIRLVVDYPQRAISKIIDSAFLGERARVLRWLRREGIAWTDPGRNLFLENAISLACYTTPARHLVFMDDDFFISGPQAVDALLSPLRGGYSLSGRYARASGRIHTSLFGLNPVRVRRELALFDGGENLYHDPSVSTGTYTYRELVQRDKGVFSIGDYHDGDSPFGRHLCHCATELWNDMPCFFSDVFAEQAIPESVRAMRLDVSILLEAMARVLGIECTPREYEHIDNERRQAAQWDFGTYFSKIFNNHLLLEKMAGEC